MDLMEIRRDLKARFWGLPQQQVDWLMSLTWPDVVVNDVADFRRACISYREVANDVAVGDWASPGALRLLELGSEVIRFETEYVEEYGRSPSMGSQDENDPKELPERDAHHRAVSAAISQLVAIGSIEDSGKRRPTRRGRVGIVYAARASGRAASLRRRPD